MRHADHSRLNTELGQTVNHGFHAHNQTLATFQTETLGSVVLVRNETLKRVSISQTVQNLGEKLNIQKSSVWKDNYNTCIFFSLG